MSEPLDPSPILDLIEAFRRSKTMFAALELGVFDGERPVGAGVARKTRQRILQHAYRRRVSATIQSAYHGRLRPVFKQRSIPYVGAFGRRRARGHASLGAILRTDPRRRIVCAFLQDRIN